MQMATIQKFEDIEIWQLARALSKKIYPLTFSHPIANDLRFKEQIRGRCGSIMDNKAEGFGRGSRNEFINSLTYARGEIDELKADVGYFNQLLFAELYADLIDKKTTAFISYLNRSGIKGQKFKQRT